MSGCARNLACGARTPRAHGYPMDTPRNICYSVNEGAPPLHALLQEAAKKNKPTMCHGPRGTCGVPIGRHTAHTRKPSSASTMAIMVPPAARQSGPGRPLADDTTDHDAVCDMVPHPYVGLPHPLRVQFPRPSHCRVKPAIEGANQDYSARVTCSVSLFGASQAPHCAKKRTRRSVPAAYAAQPPRLWRRGWAWGWGCKDVHSEGHHGRLTRACSTTLCRCPSVPARKH